MILHRCLRVLLRGLEGEGVIALAAALLFASHPVHTEAIAGLLDLFDRLYIAIEIFDSRNCWTGGCPCSNLWRVCLSDLCTQRSNR